MQLRSLLIFFSLPLFYSSNAQNDTFQVHEVNDILYYEGDGYDDEKHRLNLVLPNRDGSPILLWIHGGAWSGGNRANEMPFARQLAKSGIAVAAMSYRLSPAEFRDPPKMDGVEHPEHINDVARAIRWIYDNADKYNYSQSNLFVSGFSAGGHLSALIAMNPKYLNDLSLTFESIAGSIPISGTYDIPKYFNAIEGAYNTTFAIQHVNGVFGPKANFEDASPVNYISNLSVPMMVITDGPLSLYADTFKQALREKGRNDIKFSYYRSLSHADLHRNLSHAENSDARNEIINFIHANQRL